MKRLLVLTLLAAFGLPFGGFAAEKKKEATPVPAAGAKKPAAATPAPAAAKPQKPLPMYSRVDSIDATGKTFTNKRKDGVEVKLVVTSATEIKNGEAPAKFGDVKIGDYLSGSRLKKSETEYEIVKITKFGPKVEKPKAPAKTAAKPATDKPQ